MLVSGRDTWLLKSACEELQQTLSGHVIGIVGHAGVTLHYESTSQRTILLSTTLTSKRSCESHVV